MVKLISAEPVSVAKRLKQLIQEGIRNGKFKSQKEFCDDFNTWYKKKGLKKFEKIYTKDISNYVNGRVVPRKGRINLFAEYFNVNPEWILCEADRMNTQPTEEQRKLFEKWDKTIAPSLAEELPLWDGFEEFQKYLSAIGYRLEDYPISGDTDQDIIRTYKDGKEYTWAVEAETVSDYEFVATLPDKSEVHMTSEQVEQMLKRIRSQIGLEFNLMKGEQEHEKS